LNLALRIHLLVVALKQKNPVYIYINKDGNPSTISTRHVEANVNT